MLEKLKQQAMQRGMKLLTNPTVMKMMADPRFMNAITKSFEIKGKIQSEIDGHLRRVATALNLATKQEIAELHDTLRRIEHRCGDLERRVEPTEQ